MSQPSPFPEPGIYPLLSEEEYHAIPALSKTLIKQFAISDADAYEFIHHGKTFDAANYGSALHALILEGREHFEKRYSKAFDPSEHPDALRTNDDMKEWLRAKGEKVSGNADALAERIQKLDPEKQTLHSLRRDHEQEHAHSIQLSRAEYDEISARAWTGDYLSKLAIKEAPNSQILTEVSLFWHDDRLGVPCKARIDLLAFAEAGGIRAYDVKTFVNTREMEVVRACKQATLWHRYHIDASFYLRAIRSVPRKFHRCADSYVDWPAPGERWNDRFTLYFVEKGKAFPNVVPLELNLTDASGADNIVGQAAKATIQDAANRYRELSATNTPWNRPHAVDVIDENDFPEYAL